MTGFWGVGRRDFAKCDLQEIWIVKGNKNKKNIRPINPAKVTELAWLVKFLLWDSTGKFHFL